VSANSPKNNNESTTGAPPGWAGWLRHFEGNVGRPLPAIAGGEPALVGSIPAAIRPALARSLARFQVGEGGEGRVAREVWRVRLGSIDDAYRAALGLFVREEGRHARILGGMVRALGGELMKSSWSERLFVRGRRLAGLRLKVLCLLAAEVVGIGFYGAVGRRCGGALGAALAEIEADEAAHLRFHVALFRAETRGWAARLVFVAAWLAISGLACGLVLVDHRATLRGLGAPLAGLGRLYVGLIGGTLAAVLSGEAEAATEAAGGLTSDRDLGAARHTSDVAAGLLGL
jgi:hypothetical protein